MGESRKSRSWLGLAVQEALVECGAIDFHGFRTHKKEDMWEEGKAQPEEEKKYKQISGGEEALLRKKGGLSGNWLSSPSRKGRRKRRAGD